MKKSSRPMFLVIADLTYILARTKIVAMARKVDCIARNAEIELGLGEINERAGFLVDVAILFQLTRQDDGYWRLRRIEIDAVETKSWV